MRRAAGARVASRRARACEGQLLGSHLQVIPLFSGACLMHGVLFYDISIKYFDEVLGLFEDARQKMRVVHSTVYGLPKSA